MRYAVLVHQRRDGTYQATMPFLPDVTRIGATRDETIHSIRQAIEASLITTALVYLEISQAPAVSEHPWLTTAGMFADDLSLAPILQAIYVERESGS